MQKTGIDFHAGFCGNAEPLGSHAG